MKSLRPIVAIYNNELEGIPGYYWDKRCEELTLKEWIKISTNELIKAATALDVGISIELDNMIVDETTLIQMWDNGWFYTKLDRKKYEMDKCSAKVLANGRNS